MSNFAVDFISAIEKRKARGIIECYLELQEEKHPVNEFVSTGTLNLCSLPESMKLFYSKIKKVSIHKPREFEIFPLRNVYCCENRYIVFSKINNLHLIALDLNRPDMMSDEFDIVFLENKYIVTKTFSSFITNKVWAWIDRGRTIWKEEYSVNYQWE